MTLAIKALDTSPAGAPESEPGLTRTTMGAAAMWLGIAAVAVPLAVSPVGDRLYDLPKLVALRSLALAGIGLLAGSLLAGGRSRSLRINLWPEALALLFMGFVAVATLAGSDLGRSLWGSYERLQGLATYAAYVALFATAAWLIRSPREIERVVRAAILVSLPISVYALLEQQHIELLPRYDGYTGRSVSTLGSPSALGIYLAMMVPLTISACVSARSTAVRRLLSLILVLDVAALATSLSREGWLGAAAGLVCCVALVIRTIRPRLTVVGLAVGSGGLLTGALLLASGSLTNVAGRAGQLIDSRAGTGASRLLIWHAALQALAARPLLGYGPDNFGPVFERFYPTALLRYEGNLVGVDRAHNELLDVALAGGIPAALAFAGLIAWVLWRGLRTHRQSALAAGLIGAIAAYVVGNQFGFGMIGTETLLWVLLGLLSALSPTRAAEPVPIPGRRWLPLALGLAGLCGGVFSLVPAVRADVDFAAAIKASQTGDGRASALFDRALFLVPGDAYYQEKYATALLNLGPTPEHLTRASALLDAAVRAQPDDALAYVILGDARAYWASTGAAGQLELANAAFAHAVQLAPRRAAYYQRWADALLENHKYAAAVLRYQQASALELQDPQLYRNEAEALRQLGRTAEAEAAMASYRDVCAGHSGLCRDLAPAG